MLPTQDKCHLLGDEMLTYEYVKPQIQWSPTEEDPLTDPFRIARGLCPLGTLACTLWQRDPAKPNLATTTAWGLGARPSPRHRIYDASRLGPWLLPG